MTKPVALVTAAEARTLDEDLPPLARALDAAGIAHEIVCWDEELDWSRFAAAVLRSTWDYVPRLDEFLAWAAFLESWAGSILGTVVEEGTRRLLGVDFAFVRAASSGGRSADGDRAPRLSAPALAH